MMKIKLFHILLVIIALSCYSVNKKIEDSVGVIFIPKAKCIICKEQISNLLESNRASKSFEVHLQGVPMILLKYDHKKIDISTINQLLASNGHQTSDAIPNSESLANLPDCCK